MIYLLIFIALILISSTGLWLWINRTNAPILRKMVEEDVEQILEGGIEASEQEPEEFVSDIDDLDNKS